MPTEPREASCLGLCVERNQAASKTVLESAPFSTYSSSSGPADSTVDRYGGNRIDGAVTVGEDRPGAILVPSICRRISGEVWSLLLQPSKVTSLADHVRGVGYYRDMKKARAKGRRH